MPPSTQATDSPTTAMATTPRGRRLLPPLAAGLVLVVAAVFSPAVLRLLDDPASAPAVLGVDDVRVHDDRFDPPVIEVPAGTTVTWRFDDGGVAHNVVADGWESDVAESGSFAHTFADPGSYPYTCTLHWGMDGRVEVVPQGAASARDGRRPADLPAR